MTTAPAHITSTAPKRIYLDLGDCAHLVDPSETFATYAAGEMTWSEDNASGCGIPYVRADLAAPTSPASGALPADIRALKAALKPFVKFAQKFDSGVGGHPKSDRVASIDGVVLTAGDFFALLKAVTRPALAVLASREASPATLPSVEFTLRAMALNYTRGHSWDHLDTEACQRGADEIKRLNAALASPQAAPVQPPEPAIWLTQKEFYLLSKAKKTERETVPLYLAAPAPVAPTPAQPSTAALANALKAITAQGDTIARMLTEGKVLTSTEAQHQEWKRMQKTWDALMSQAAATLPSEPEGESA